MMGQEVEWQWDRKQETVGKEARDIGTGSLEMMGQEVG